METRDCIINTPSHDGRIVGIMQIERPNSSMMRGRMMLGEVIREIVFASSPIYVELALTDAIAYPIIAHVHCLGTSLLYGVVGDALRGVVVGADGSWSLLMAEFFQRGTLWDCVLAVMCTDCHSRPLDPLPIFGVT